MEQIIYGRPEKQEVPSFVDPTITTNYSVSIGNGTCSELLTVAVAPGQELNFALVDTLYMGLDEIQTLQGPSGFATYNWYPTDQLDNPFGEIVSITGSTSFTLFLEATHSSGCVIKDSVVIIVVDLDIPNGFSPNDDSFNDLYIVPQLYYLDGSLKVWNRWGDVVFESDHYENNWDGTCQTSLCVGNEGLPEGTYFYAITVGDIDFDGYITLKR